MIFVRFALALPILIRILMRRADPLPQCPESTGIVCGQVPRLVSGDGAGHVLFSGNLPC